MPGTDPHAPQDPRSKAPRPPFEYQPQVPPGLEGPLRPRADHGESTYRGQGLLEGRAALITGADSGIGKAVALAFAREGADVLISYLDEEEDALDTERLVGEAGRKAVRMAGDVGCPDHCRKLVERTMEAFGRLDILVNNAARPATFPDLEGITPEVVEDTFRTNVFSLFHLCREAVPRMKPGGCIINTASIEASQPTPNLLTYASTKGAVATFTKGLAGLLAPRGIRVNAVAPGPIWTPLIALSQTREDMEGFGADTPLERPGQPAELAAIYVLLASERGSYMDAGIYPVTGGRML